MREHELLSNHPASSYIVDDSIREKYTGDHSDSIFYEYNFACTIE